MTKKELRKLYTTPDWRRGASEGSELHALLPGLITAFREKLGWLEEAGTLSLRFQASRKKMKTRRGAK